MGLTPQRPPFGFGHSAGLGASLAVLDRGVGFGPLPMLANLSGPGAFGQHGKRPERQVDSPLLVLDRAGRQVARVEPTIALDPLAKLVASLLRRDGEADHE